MRVWPTLTPAVAFVCALGLAACISSERSSDAAREAELPLVPPGSQAEVNCLATATDLAGVEGIVATRVVRLGATASDRLANGYQVHMDVPGANNRRY